MKIRERKSSEWSREESDRRGGYVEFFENGERFINYKTDLVVLPPLTSSTFIYLDELTALFDEVLNEQEKKKVKGEENGLNY